ncbi:hypothetical protein EK21DRAFT_16053, partial [Setomelanomma holmii]
AFCCYWCAVSVCILTAFGAFALDLVFTQFGMGTGMARWIVHGNGNEDVTSYDMHFCLTSPNRQAPGPQYWRYISTDPFSNCATEIVTLSAMSTEQWKLFLDDIIVV